MVQPWVISYCTSSGPYCCRDCSVRLWLPRAVIFCRLTVKDMLQVSVGTRGMCSQRWELTVCHREKITLRIFSIVARAFFSAGASQQIVNKNMITSLAQQIIVWNNNNQPKMLRGISSQHNTKYKSIGNVMLGKDANKRFRLIPQSSRDAPRFSRAGSTQTVAVCARGWLTLYWCDCCIVLSLSPSFQLWLFLFILGISWRSNIFLLVVLFCQLLWAVALAFVPFSQVTSCKDH